MEQRRNLTRLSLWGAILGLTAGGAGAIDLAPEVISSTTTFSHFRNQIPADVNGDGRVDVLAHLGTGSLVWYENTGDGWTQRPIATDLIGTQQLGAGDLDDDGDLDLFTGSFDTPLKWHRNEGGANPTFVSGNVLPVRPRRFVSEDLDGDGDLDFAVDSVGSPFEWYENDGGQVPGFTSHTIAGPEVSDLLAADIDGDGDVDLAAPRGDGIFWFDNDGGSPPTFTEREVSGVGAPRLTVGDVEGDGDLDLISNPAPDLVWHENTGTVPPGWKTRTIVSGLRIGDRNTVNLAAVDLDLDGDLEVFTHRYLFNNLGGFPPQWEEEIQFYPYGGSFGSGSLSYAPGHMRNADFNGDGLPDILTSVSHGTTNCDPFPLPPNCRSSSDSTLRVHRNASRLSLQGDVEFVDASGDGINDPGEPGVVRVTFQNRSAVTLHSLDAAATALSGEFSFGAPVVLGTPVSPDHVGIAEFPYTTLVEAPCGSPLIASYEIISVDLPLLSLRGPVSAEHIGGMKPVIVSAMDAPGLTIPDNDPAGLERSLTLSTEGQTLKGLTLILDISHTFRGDLEVTLVHPGGAEATVIEADGLEGIDIMDAFPVSALVGLIGDGTYTLRIRDNAVGDIGTLNGWGLVADYEIYQCTPWIPGSVIDLLLGLAPKSTVFDVNGDGTVDASDLVMMVNGTN